MEFAIDRGVFDEDGCVDEEAAERYADELMERFAASPEGGEVVEESGGLAWAHAAIGYGLSHAGVDIAQMGRRDLVQILFGTFPRKISCAPEEAPEIIRELRAFWRFVQREYDAPFASECLALLESPGLAEAVERELADRSNWGMAKSFVMDGQAAGYDMTTQEGMTAYQLAYNAALMERAAQRDADTGVRTWLTDDKGLADDRKGPVDDRKARRRKRKAQKHSRRRNR